MRPLTARQRAATYSYKQAMAAQTRRGWRPWQIAVVALVYVLAVGALGYAAVRLLMQQGGA